MAKVLLTIKLISTTKSSKLESIAKYVNFVPQGTLSFHFVKIHLVILSVAKNDGVWYFGYKVVLFLISFKALKPIYIKARS